MLPLVIGGGFEYESTSDERQYDVPLFLQYSFTETFQATLESSLTRIDAKNSNSTSVTGLDDLETSFEYEFLRERRYRPAVGMLAGVTWPTATDPDIGVPDPESFFGLIVSKEFGFTELDLNVIYTHAGDPEEPDIIEMPMALQYSLTRVVDLAAEVVPTIDAGGGVGGNGSPTEYTLGVVWHTSDFWVLESGVTYKDDGTWQLTFGWEYSFGGDD
ncbi:MAG: hypothetical protein K8S98_11385 [Planctomycetes bacterium]|nr:hypothetical protein [Planctomycetota bacterium]